VVAGSVDDVGGKKTAGRPAHFRGRERTEVKKTRKDERDFLDGKGI